MLNLKRKELINMLMPSVNELQFGSTQDIVDYTSRSFIPKKDEFEQVMIHLRHPDTTPRNPGTDSVYISADVVPATLEEREAVAKVLERVYENRKRNRRNVLVTVGVIAGVVIGGHIFLFSHRHQKEKDELNAYRAAFSGDIHLAPPTPVL